MYIDIVQDYKCSTLICLLNRHISPHICVLCRQLHLLAGQVSG